MSLLVTNVSRRSVIKTLGLATGFVLSTSVVPRGLRALVGGGSAGPLSPSVYLAIDEDGTVRVYVHRAEMGQGSRTGLTQIIADELEADWDRLQVMPAYGDKKFGSQNTDGSSSIRLFYDAFRTAGATARTMLEEAAAAHWGVDRSQVEARNHQVHNRKSGEALDYRTLVAAAALLDVPDPESVTLKSRAQHRYIGKPVQQHLRRGLRDGPGRLRPGRAPRRDGLRGGGPPPGGRRPPRQLRPGRRDGGARRAGRGRAAGLRVPHALPAPGRRGRGRHQHLGGHPGPRGARRRPSTAGPNGDYDTTAYEASLWRAIEAGGTVTYDRGDVSGALSSSARRIRSDYFVPASAPHSHGAPRGDGGVGR